MPGGYFAIKEDRSFTAGDYVAGTRFNGDLFTVPEFDGDRYFGIAFDPEVEPSHIVLATGASQDIMQDMTQEADVTIGFARLETWVSDHVFFPAMSGHAFRVLEA